MKWRRRRRLLVRRRAAALVAGACAVAVLLPGAAVGAQTTDALQIEAVDTSASPQVTLTVRPPKELANETLTSGVFHLTENGKSVPITVTRVDSRPAQAQQPFEVVLVIDTSGSMNGAPLDAAKQAAKSFLHEMPAGARVAVVPFGDTPSVATPLTQDRSAALAAIDGLQARGETALFDAINLGLGQFSSAKGVRHAIVVMSDGGDTVSTATLNQTVSALGTNDLEFAAVELVTPEYDGTALHALAGAANGSVLSANDPGQLTTLFKSVAANLLNRYLITYQSTAGGETDIALTLAAKGIKANTHRPVQLPELASPAPVPAPTAAIDHGPGFLGSRSAFLGALGIFFLGLAALLSWLILQPRENAIRLANGLGQRTGRVRLPAVRELAERLSDRAEQQLKRSGREPALEALLERGGVSLRPGEYVAIAGGATVVGLLLGVLVGGPVVGILLAAIIGIGFVVYVRRRASLRAQRFADQLADTLQLLTGSLRAGHSVLQSMDAVANDAPSPTKEEFQRLVVETRVGRDLRDAMWAMHRRLGNQDFEWVTQALEIHREVGGDLAEILDTVANTVRERSRLRRQIKTLSAEGRLSAMILFALPFAVAILVSILNPGYLSPLFHSGLGVGLVALGCATLTVGAFWLRRLVRIEL